MKYIKDTFNQKLDVKFSMANGGQGCLEVNYSGREPFTILFNFDKNLAEINGFENGKPFFELVHWLKYIQKAKDNVSVTLQDDEEIWQLIAENVDRETLNFTINMQEIETTICSKQLEILVNRQDFVKLFRTKLNHFFKHDYPHFEQEDDIYPFEDIKDWFLSEKW